MRPRAWSNPASRAAVWPKLLLNLTTNALKFTKRGYVKVGVEVVRAEDFGSLPGAPSAYLAVYSASSCGRSVP